MPFVLGIGGFLKLQKKTEAIWTLPCPKCGKLRKFRYNSFWGARKRKSVCYSCAGYGKKPGVRLIPEQISDVLRLHKEGKTNRKIAKEIGVCHITVATVLKKHGLECNGTKRHKLNRLENGMALCSKCEKPKPEREFMVNRRGTKYEYPFSYCAECRKNRDYLVINSSPERYVHRVFMRLRRGTKNQGILCTITKEQIWQQFQRQNGRCFYTDIPMRCRVGEGESRNSFSIDKITPENGYVLGNVVLCTRRANTIKSDMTLDEMKTWMPGWYARVERFIKTP